MYRNESLSYAFLNTLWKALYVLCFMAHVLTNIVRRFARLGLYVAWVRIRIMMMRFRYWLARRNDDS